MGIEYLKSPARLLNRDYVNKGDLVLFKKVLLVSVGQRGAVLPAVKVGGLKKILTLARHRRLGSSPAEQQNFFKSNFFQTSNFDSSQPCGRLTYRHPKYLFGKISTLLTNTYSIKMTRRIFNGSYALSK